MPPARRRRLIAAAAIGIPWLLFLLWASSAEEYRQANLWARLGLYGPVVHPELHNLAHVVRYDAARVAHTDQQIRFWGNLVFLFPLGVVAALVWEGLRWWHVLVAATVVAFLVQARDPIFRHTGSVTWNQILPNIAGAMAGFGLVVAGDALWRRLGHRPTHVEEVADRG